MIYLSIILGLILAGFGIFFITRAIIKIRLEHRIRSAAFKTLYQASIMDVVDVCEEVGSPYWFTEGTLIGLLRYGANCHESREQSVDDDIDVMVEVQDQEAWIKTKKLLIAGLEKRGWGGFYERTTSSAKKGRIDKMQMWKRAGRNIVTHVDFHSYFANKKFAHSHAEPNSYPFQHWGDKLPISMLYPIKKCLCYGREVPCPNDAISILKGWNGGEYEDSNLAFPLEKVTEQERQAIIQKAKELDKKGYASMMPEIKNT
jgi:hypothetical protein